VSKISPKTILNKSFLEINLNVQKLKFIRNEILNASKIIEQTIKKNKVFFCGNGGSASDAAHVSAELLGRFLKERKALPSICLSTNLSAITAIANDYDYKKIFSRQLEGMGKKGDLIFAISTSGKSKNILEVLKQAKKMKIKTILLTGNNKIRYNVDVCIKAPAHRVDRIQELHITILHLICEIIDSRF